MISINTPEVVREDIRRNLIQEAVRHIQERAIYQDKICELVVDREANEREINEYSEKVAAAKAAYQAVMGVAVHCFGLCLVDFQNQAYATYERYEAAKPGRKNGGI